MISKHIEGGAGSEAHRRHHHLHSPAYSSRFMTKGLPKHEIPRSPVSPSEAFQIVSDCLTLDRNPTQNMATFVTSWIEPKGEKLMNMTMNKNMADVKQYPQMLDIQQRCISMISKLFNGKEGAVGVPTIGSSEAFMLAALSMKFNWRDRMKEKGRPAEKPNIIFGKNAQVALEKFARYFDVEARTVNVTADSNYCIDVSQVRDLIDENTIGVVGILGSTYTGHYEPIGQLNELVDEVNLENGWNIPIHVDAASGGFIAPFLEPDLVWDFRLKWVHSINVSSHKYGLVPPGLGWCIWKDAKALNKDLIFHLSYLGGDNPTFTLNFSKSASPIVAQYYNFVRLGHDGYKHIISNCRKNAVSLSNKLNETKYFTVISRAERGVPVVAFHLNENTKNQYSNFDEYDVANYLQIRGWQVPAYELPHKCDNMTIMRVVVREMHSEDLLEILIKDLTDVVDNLVNATYTRSREIKMPGAGHSFKHVC